MACDKLRYSAHWQPRKGRREKTNRRWSPLVEISTTKLGLYGHELSDFTGLVISVLDHKKICKNPPTYYCSCLRSSRSFPISASKTLTSVAIPLVKSIIILRFLERRQMPVSFSEFGRRSERLARSLKHSFQVKIRHLQEDRLCQTLKSLRDCKSRE